VLLCLLVNVGHRLLFHGRGDTVFVGELDIDYSSTGEVLLCLFVNVGHRLLFHRRGDTVFVGECRTASFSPAASSTGTDWMIPPPQRLKYKQIFNSHDPTHKGFLTGT